MLQSTCRKQEPAHPGTPGSRDAIVVLKITYHFFLKITSSSKQAMLEYRLRIADGVWSYRRFAVLLHDFVNITLK